MALPRTDRTRGSLNTVFVAPRTPLEKEIANVWAEVLTLDVIGIHDNFFDLGGHSLTATKIVSRIVRNFQADVPVQGLLAAGSVAEMAGVIAAHQAKNLGEHDVTQILTELESLSDEEAENISRGKEKT